MKIASYNVNGIRAAERLGMSDWLKNFDADIYCLQEVRADEQVCKDILSKLREYNAYYNCGGRKGYAGTTILTKGMPNKIEIGFGKQDDEGRTLSLFFDDFTLVNSYVPNGNQRLDFKLEYMQKLLEYVEMLKKQNNVIICSDTNVAYSEKDCSHPKLSETKSGFLPVERQRLSKFFGSGFVDAYRQFNPNNQAYSWRSYRSRQAEGEIGTKFRFDYIMVNDKLLSKLKGCEIPELEYSDHLPIIADLNMHFEYKKAETQAKGEQLTLG